MGKLVVFYPGVDGGDGWLEVQDGLDEFAAAVFGPKVDPPCDDLGLLWGLVEEGLRNFSLERLGVLTSSVVVLYPRMVIAESSAGMVPSRPCRMSKYEALAEAGRMKSALKIWPPFVGSWSLYVAEVMMPKLGVAPRRAQNKSGFKSSEASRIFPLAVTRRTDRRLSIISPLTPWKRPMPPPPVTPTTPGQLQVPTAVKKGHVSVMKVCGLGDPLGGH